MRMENFECKADLGSGALSLGLRVLWVSKDKTRDAEWEAGRFQRNFGYLKYVYKTGLRCLGSWSPFLLLSSPILFGPLVQPDWSGCYLLVLLFTCIWVK